MNVDCTLKLRYDGKDIENSLAPGASTSCPSREGGGDVEADVGRG